MKKHGRGIRTRFSDDLLWLPYLVLEYIKFTGDYSLLEEETPYVVGEILKDGEDERYDKYLESEERESIYKHCIRAIEKSFNFGENGLPKIGTGDWNDGFSTVGNKGKGESVWLGFFLYKILDGFIEVCKRRVEEGKEDSNIIEKFEKIKLDLKRALNTKGWDGRWFKRAFMDDGSALGSMENEECRIDSIAQSWSIISNAGDNDKKYISMESLENHLIDKENGIIKLLDPPFEKGKLEPGYIKAYLPGVRENGGQYTHAACWVIIAQTMLGFGDKALELYRMINPIEHSRTKDACNKYKVEPYSMPADIYGASNLAGRGGWTLYTGSASWYYDAGIEYILGLKIENGVMKFEPCIPKDWKEYLIRYKWGKSIYNIKIKNPNQKNTGVEKVFLNGNEVANGIRLDGNNRIFNVEVIM
ncbi:MAG: GH36-type glycosyl hydrolase domain-containing protein [Clostridia bacterium]